ncbi:glycosyltransferase [Leptothrix discophora]|uniref:Glycosyltransferase n=1 Tax=Leptothrix discophora TaxID=89 RepID=A0ABT9FXU3_LEPDI|nr:glycosyltransferase [Leptothrix discophora]MDP4299062.1 glycosyltransferase [Leptothrix discophora]
MSEVLVTICICTFRRPRLLEELLRSLTGQLGVDFLWNIVVIDNDEEETAAKVVIDFCQSERNIHIDYLVERRQGISYARNSAVRNSNGEYIAFIDDDEIASPGWLASLVNVAKATGADAVLGPVLPEYPPNTATWIKRTRFFDRPRYKTGEVLSANDGKTCNALLKRSILNTDQVFDEKLAFTGSEDFELFYRLKKFGRIFVWSDEAVVYEKVPLSRQKLSWMLERSLRPSIMYWRIVGKDASVIKRIAHAALGFWLGFPLVLLALMLFPFDRCFGFLLARRGLLFLGRCFALTKIEMYGYQAKDVTSC